MFHGRSAPLALVTAAMLFVGSAPAYAVDEPTAGATVIDEFRADNKNLLASSILRIDAFEARLGPVAFVGHAGPYEARLEEIASDLSLRVPLRTADLVAAVQSMAELPGLTVRATTTRDEARQNSYGLTVESEYKPFAATVQLANRGTRDVGPMFVFNEIAASGLLGFSERLGAFASTATDTDEYRGCGAG
jgi:hemolysin activation/secretion protein